MDSIWRLDQFDWRTFGLRLWSARDGIMAQSARLSFYLMFALFPFLLFLTALLGVLLETEAVLRDVLQEQLYRIAPKSVTSLLDSAVKQIAEESSAGKLSLGLLFALWAASSGMRALIDALNLAYQINETRRWWKRRLVALGLTITFLTLALLALALLLYGPMVVNAVGRWAALGSPTKALWSVSQWMAMVLFLLLAFNILYVYGPNVKHREWRWLMPGTVLGVLLWIGISSGLKIYLSFYNRYSATYGSIGGAIILLLWLYLTSVALILGGELNSAIEQRNGKLNEKEQS